MSFRRPYSNCTSDFRGIANNEDTCKNYFVFVSVDPTETDYSERPCTPINVVPNVWTVGIPMGTNCAAHLARSLKRVHK